MNKIKKWIKSRTINWALVMGLLGVLEAQSGAIQSFIGDKFGLDVGTLYAVLFSMLMVIMRIQTTTSLGEK